MEAESPEDPKTRASIFLTLVSKNGPVWGLRNEAGGLATWKYDESEETLIPFWSDEEGARSCAEATFPDYRVFEMSARAFTETILPQLEEKGILVGVNLSEKMGGVDLPAPDLLDEIRSASS